MTSEQKIEFVKRISSLQPSDPANFGKMSVSQMLCHCSDLFRVMFGEITGLKRQQVDVNKFREMIARNETLPVIDGLDQVAGGGTKPGAFENDKQKLIEYLNRFYDTGNDFAFSVHPYFGDITRDHWERLMIFHLNHHLNQFSR